MAHGDIHRVRFAEWHPIGLDDERVAVWLTVGAVGHVGAGRIEHRIGWPPGVLPAERQPIGILVPVRHVDPNLVEAPKAFLIAPSG